MEVSAVGPKVGKSAPVSRCPPYPPWKKTEPDNLKAFLWADFDSIDVSRCVDRPERLHQEYWQPSFQQFKVLGEVTSTKEAKEIAQDYTWRIYIQSSGTVHMVLILPIRLMFLSGRHETILVCATNVLIASMALCFKLRPDAIVSCNTILRSSMRKLSNIVDWNLPCMIRQVVENTIQIFGRWYIDLLDVNQVGNQSGSIKQALQHQSSLKHRSWYQVCSMIWSCHRVLMLSSDYQVR